jgi:hypothetical protein
MPISKWDYSRDLRPAKWDSMINLRCKKSRSWLFSNSGRALALPATDAAVFGTSALYGRQLPRAIVTGPFALRL